MIAGGEVKEQGSHKELTKAKGAYWGFVEVENEQYVLSLLLLSLLYSLLRGERLDNSWQTLFLSSCRHCGWGCKPLW